MVQELQDTLPSLRRTRDQEAWFLSRWEARGLGGLEAEIARKRVVELDHLISQIASQSAR